MYCDAGGGYSQIVDRNLDPYEVFMIRGRTDEVSELRNF